MDEAKICYYRFRLCGRKYLVHTCIYCMGAYKSIHALTHIDLGFHTVEIHKHVEMLRVCRLLHSDLKNSF